MSKQVEHQQVQVPQERQGTRFLYEQTASKTLIFTTSTTNNLNLAGEAKSAYTGLYQCTLEPSDDGGESQETCHIASKLADWRNFRMKHGELTLRNLQFDLSSLRSEFTNKKDKDSKKNYIYANTRSDIKDFKKTGFLEWEIIRAQLPEQGDTNSNVLLENGTLQFQSVFRTIEAFEWNECNFECCERNDKLYDSWDEDHVEQYKHAYVRAFVRSFAVDEHTGDIFISWEGFYKDCGNVFTSNKKLEWTIGVSRLKTEERDCVFKPQNDLTYEDMSYVARCTEPVSIVYQSSVGRDIVLSYGGFAVIPTSSVGYPYGTGKRSFLLNVLETPDLDGAELYSKVWAFPEGAIHLKDGVEIQELTGEGTKVEYIFMNTGVWDGGTLRVHYDPVTHKPDHLCRTIYEKGIECFPIAVMIRHDVPVVYSIGEAEQFLTKEQTEMFCRLEDADYDSSFRMEWARKTTMATGLDVQWRNGQPHRIFFGCWGEEGGNGNFGSVEKGGNNLMTVMDNVYAEAVLFLPEELEGTIDYRPEPEHHYTIPEGVTLFDNNQPSDKSKTSPHKTFYVSNMMVVLLVFLGVVCATVYKRKRQLRVLALDLETETGIRIPYVELRNLDDAPIMMSSPSQSPIDEEEEARILI